MSSDIKTEAEYRGVRFRLEARAVEQGVAPGETFIGHFVLLDGLSTRNDAHSFLPLRGVDDLAHPSIDLAWSTENEALTYAAEAAHSATEVLQDVRM